MNTSHIKFLLLFSVSPSGCARSESSAPDPPPGMRVLTPEEAAVDYYEPDASSPRPTTIRVDVHDPRPLAEATKVLERGLGSVVTYEDVMPMWAGDVVADDRRTTARWGRLDLTVEPARGLEQEIQRIVDVHAATDGVGTFEVRRTGARLHVVPSAIRDARGSWQPVAPLLDTVIELHDGQYSVDAALSMWSDSLEVETGVRVILFWTPSGGTTTLSSSATARDHLIGILDSVDPRLSWRLLADPSGRWGLNVRRACVGDGC